MQGSRRDDVAEWRLANVLGGVGVTLERGTGDALIPPPILRGLAEVAATAEGRGLDDRWDEEFAAMLGHAASKGRIDGAGAIRAHVEWRDA